MSMIYIYIIELDGHVIIPRHLKHYGMERSIAKRQILLSEANRLKRLAFAKELIQWSDDKLNSIFWTDETKVQSWPNGEIVFY